MQTKVELQPAYVLHTRSYRETSQLVDFITPEYGRVCAIAKGARRGKTSQQSLLQPFARVLISWHGKNELKILRGVEEQSVRQVLQGDALFSGMYINELLVRLLKAQDNCERLFDGYGKTLQQLVSQIQIEPVLRRFELLMLKELGYGIPFPESLLADTQTSHLSAVEVQYYYAQDGHFTELSDPPVKSQLPRCFSANELQAIADEKYDQAKVLFTAKRLMRLAFNPLLGGRALRSRELFKPKDAKNE